VTFRLHRCRDAGCLTDDRGPFNPSPSSLGSSPTTVASLRTADPCEGNVKHCARNDPLRPNPGRRSHQKTPIKPAGSNFSATSPFDCGSGSRGFEPRYPPHLRAGSPCDDTMAPARRRSAPMTRAVGPAVQQPLSISSADRPSDHAQWRAQADSAARVPHGQHFDVVRLRDVIHVISRQ
jgi:hypothetical protein